MATASAGEIAGVFLRMDGSSHPPGDALGVAVLLPPAVQDASLEVLAYTVSGEGNNSPKPILARSDCANRSDSGHFQVRQPLVRNGKEVESLWTVAVGERRHLRRVYRVLVAPYADLVLSVGKHKIGYEVRLFIEGRMADAVATELTAVEVGDGVRTTMVVLQQSLVPVKNELAVRGFSWQNGALAARDYSQDFTVWKPVMCATQVQVEIKGGFERTKTAESQVLGWMSSRESVPERRRTIYFATNRELQKPSDDFAVRYGNQPVLALDKMTYGSCVVSIPVMNHRAGNVELPGTRFWFWAEKPDVNRHFIVERFDALSVEALRSSIRGSDVLLYVHGYNNGLKDAVMRSAQLQYDLEFAGTMMAFSWPSAGNLADYRHDERAAEGSPGFLAEVLANLLAWGEGDGRKVHVIAHSMGNRILLQALHELKTRGTTRKLGQVIMAAADVDGITYANARDDLVGSCERVTYYFAADDAALVVSRGLHVDRPIGLAAMFDKGMDTISAQGQTALFHDLGHCYFGNSKALLTDIRLLLSQSLPPTDRRPPLGLRVEGARELFYWTFATPSY